MHGRMHASTHATSSTQRTHTMQHSKKHVHIIKRNATHACTDTRTLARSLACMNTCGTHACAHACMHTRALAWRSECLASLWSLVVCGYSVQYTYCLACCQTYYRTPFQTGGRRHLLVVGTHSPCDRPCVWCGRSQWSPGERLARPLYSGNPPRTHTRARGCTRTYSHICTCAHAQTCTTTSPVRRWSHQWYWQSSTKPVANLRPTHR